MAVASPAVEESGQKTLNYAVGKELAAAFEILS
jgi:hypothetical protein